MLLLYDAKCPVCRNLAQRIHFVTEKKVEIRSLSTPEAHTVLEKFYPEGWPHDFYVVENGSCKRGVRALPKLLKSVETAPLRGSTKSSRADLSWGFCGQRRIFTWGPISPNQSKSAIPARASFLSDETGSDPDALTSNSTRSVLTKRPRSCPSSALRTSPR